MPGTALAGSLAVGVISRPPAIPPRRPVIGPVDLALVAVTLVWGLNNVALKRALTQFLPLSFNAVRFTIATVLIFGLLLLTERRISVPRAHLPQLLVAGLLGNAVYQVGFIKGLSLSTAGNVSFVLATMPASTALISHLLGIERLPWRGWLGFGVTLSGCALIILSGGGTVSFGSQTVRGDLLVLLATLGWCCYTIMSKRLVESFSPLALTAWTMGLGAVGLVVLSIPDLLRQDWTQPDALSWLALVGSAVLALVFCYVVWNWGLRVIGTARTAIYGNLSPLWTGFFGWLLLHETWGPARVAGAALILAGVATVRRAAASRSEQRERG